MAKKILLIHFPHAGAYLSSNPKWQALLPEWLTLKIILLPGRGTRVNEPFLTKIEEAITDLYTQTKELIQQPFILYGHSLGGALVFELTRYLRRQQLPLPLHLFISGHSAPHLPALEPPIYHLPDLEFITELQRQHDSIPPEIVENAELLKLFLPVLKADVTMVETYQCAPEPPLPIPITTISGQEDKMAVAERLREWKSYTTNTFRHYTVPGNHLGMLADISKIFTIIQNDLNDSLIKSN